MAGQNMINQSVAASECCELCSKERKIDPEFSNRITALRFVLAVFVVFIHNSIGDSNFVVDNVAIEMPLWVQIIYRTIHDYWAGIAVPTFFIISGYLFFAKPKPFFKTIQSKFRGIVVPYVLWTALAILFFYILQNLGFYVPSCQENIVNNWNKCDYFRTLWAWDIPPIGEAKLHHPYIIQFWYIRDLMIMMILSPLIKYFAGKFPATWLFFVTLLNVAEMLQITNIQYGFTGALFYFSLGFYAVNHIRKVLNFIDTIRWRDFIATYVILYVLIVYVDINKINNCGFLYWGNLLFTIGFAFKIAGVVDKNEIFFGKLSYLSAFSFWVFAAHLPFVLTVIKKVFYKIIPMHGVWILVHFFGVVFLCVVLLVTVGIIFKKFLPKVFAVLNGGR